MREADEMNNAFPTNTCDERNETSQRGAETIRRSPRGVREQCICVVHPTNLRKLVVPAFRKKNTHVHVFISRTTPAAGSRSSGPRASRERARSRARDGAGARGLRYASDDSCLIDTYMVKQGARSRRAVSKTSVRTTRRRTGGTGVREHERARRRETRRVAPGGVGGRSVTSGARARIRGKPSSRRSRGASSRRAHP